MHFGAESVLAYDMDGASVWTADVGRIKTLGLGVGTSPILYRDLLILPCDDNEGADSFIVGLDKRSGREVWRTPRDVQISWSTPVLVDAPARAGNPARPEVVTNGTEWIVAYDPAAGKELRRVIAIRTGGPATMPAAERIAWTYDKGTAYVVSPNLFKGIVYLANGRIYIRGERHLFAIGG